MFLANIILVVSHLKIYPTVHLNIRSTFVYWLREKYDANFHLKMLDLKVY